MSYRVDREKIERAIIAFALGSGKVEITDRITMFRDRQPFRISQELLELWTGMNQPTPELEARLLESGLEILPAGGLAKCWEVRRAGEAEGRLF